MQPWLSREKSLLGDRIQLTTVAGTMVFAEIAKADVSNDAARTLALEGADAALKEKDGGIPLWLSGGPTTCSWRRPFSREAGRCRSARAISIVPRSC